MRGIVKYIVELIILAIALLLIGLGAFFGYHWYENYQFKKHRPQIVMQGNTNISPAFQTDKIYKKRLNRDYDFIFRVSYLTPPKTWDGYNAVIPGLRATKAYDFEKKKYTQTDTMTPQGITIAGKFLLITAYDGEHKRNSVIYVLDKKTNKFIKTIQVPKKPHLGGITYDPVAKNIWITGSVGGKSALQSFSMKSLKAYPKKSLIPIQYNHTVIIPSMPKASTVTYYGGNLLVGYFDLRKRGTVSSFRISRSGKYKNSIGVKEVATKTGNAIYSDPDGQTSMDEKIQGIAVYDDKIFLSQSYGSQSSKLYVFPISAINALSEQNAELVIKMPPYLEQITAYKGQLLCIFESAASQYANPDIVIMDRILSMNINGLFSK
ncbi:MAG: hypothetical protein Q3960_04680 [Lactobacillus sp.]|nr:hypothetical protein [Lactobacillus sp.]